MIVLPRRPGIVRGSAVFVPLAILAFIVTGCATSAKPPALPQPPVPQWESSRLIESISQRRQQFRSVRALARVNYAGPEGKHGFEEAVLVQRPDRLRLETLTFLGAILIVTANDKEIIGYHPREGVLVRGRSSKENLLRLTQIPLELDEITALLIGLPPVEVVGAVAPRRQLADFFSQRPDQRYPDIRFAAAGADPLAALQWQRRARIDRVFLRLHHDSGRLVSIQDQCRGTPERQEAGDPLPRAGIQRDHPRRIVFSAKAAPMSKKFPSR